MADDAIVIEDANAVDRNVDTRTIGTDHRQVVVIGDPATGAGVAPVDATNGLAVDVKAAAALATGDNTVGRVKLTDGTDTADVLDLTNSNPLTVAVVNATGDQITSFGGSGGTAEVDDAAFTAASDSGTPIMGFVSSDTVDSGDVGVVAMTTARALHVNLASSGLDVDHDSADSGQPVALGGRAANTLASSTSGGLRPVATDDRVKLIADLWGRLLVSHLDPNMSVWKAYNTTSCPASGSGAAIWTPASGKKIAVTSLEVSVYGTTSGRLVIYWGDATYSAGVDHPLFIGSFAPSSTVKPGAVMALSTPVYHNTADDPLRIHQLDGGSGMSVDVIVNGYEY